MLEKLLRPRTAAGIVLALVLAAGTAVAATSTGPRPELPQEETTSTTQATTTSTAVDETTTSTTNTTNTTEAPTTSTTASTVKPDANGDHPDNHGACVSAAAHDTPPGPGHGAAVSKVAHSDCGKSAKGGHDDGGSETEAPDTNDHDGS